MTANYMVWAIVLLGGYFVFLESKVEQSFLFVSTLPVPLRPYICEQLKRIQGSVDLLRKREDEEDFEQELEDIMRRSVAGISSITIMTHDIFIKALI